LFDGSAVTAAAQGVVSFVIKGNVEDRAEIEVESENAQELSGDFTMSSDECNIVLISQLLGIGWFTSDQSQSGDASSFLIDRDDRLHFAQVAEIIDQFTKPGRTLDVTAEKNIPTRLDPSEQASCFGVKLDTGDSSKDQLT
jgi:hypothetical protein